MQLGTLETYLKEELPLRVSAGVDQVSGEFTVYTATIARIPTVFERFIVHKCGTELRPR